MIANTYVVKPFGISEVKVIALKGDPGSPTQEQVNTAVEEYMDDHPEAQIPDGAVTTEKLASNAVAPYADNLVSSSHVSDSEPYLFRKTFAGVREDTELVGGSIVWNQWMQEINESSQATNWGASNGTLSYSGGRIVFTASANNNNKNFGQKTSVSETSVTGHIYFYSAIINRSKGGANFVVAPRVGQTFTLTEVPDGVDTLVRGVFKASGVSALRFFFYPWGIGAALTDGTEMAIVAHPQIIDLTLMFGPTIADYIYSLETATAGAGVAFFRSLFNKPYYPYNAGEIISVKTSAHKMVGFNQWDEEWELGDVNSSTGKKTTATNRIRSKNFIRVIPGVRYFINASYSSSACYDADKNYISQTPYANGPVAGTYYFDIPNNACYILFGMPTSYGATYKNDICINISDPSKNGQYEPYTEVVYSLSPIDLRGLPKIENGVIEHDGDIYKSDGTVERRWALLDLGTLNYTYVPTYSAFVSDTLPTRKLQTAVLSSKYTYTTAWITSEGWTTGDNLINSTGSDTRIRIKDTAYSNATAFKAAMSGVYILIALETPVTEQAGPYINLQRCYPDGTEEYIDTREVPIPVGHNTRYMRDLKKLLEGIPDAPSADGTYTLKVTISNGVATYSWW